MVRKEAKGYGAGNWIEGRENMPNGAKICVVEDTVTTGEIVTKAIQELRRGWIHRYTNHIGCRSSKRKVLKN